MGKVRYYFDKKTAAKIIKAAESSFSHKGYVIVESNDAIVDIVEKMRSDWYLVPIGVKTVGDDGVPRDGLVVAAINPAAAWEGVRQVIAALELSGATPDSIAKMREQIKADIEARASIVLSA